MYIHGIFKNFSTYNIESGYENNAIDKHSSEIVYIKLHNKCQDKSNQYHAVFLLEYKFLQSASSNYLELIQISIMNTKFGRSLRKNSIFTQDLNTKRHRFGSNSCFY